MTGPRPARAAWRDGLAYGALGLPLAFVALPLYVQLPHHYASRYGVALATLGALLLAARLLDALADPWIGRAADRWLDRGQALPVAAAAALVAAAGFHALFHPPLPGGAALLAWAALALAATYLAYSVLAVLHQAWGARLGGNAPQRARIVAWREGLALAGVLVASVLPALAGFGVVSAVFALALLLGWLAWRQAPAPQHRGAAAAAQPLRLPFTVPAFRRLLLVFLLNGTAAAVPATLVLFFVRDRLQAPALEPVFLAAYFAAGALALPLWVRAVARWGLVHAWLAGMLLAVAGFAGAAGLGHGDSGWFLLVCVASGVALGADLALPGALLAGVVQRAGHAGAAEGAYFGWWNCAAKLNLAMAAGLALPLLQLLGYAPGRQDEPALHALTLAYCALPCALKLAAAALLYRWRHTWTDDPEPTP